MRTKRLLSIALLPLLMLSMHCKEDEPLTELEKLPPATQNGKRTFGCLVDGKAWVINNIASVQSDYQLGHLSISAGVSNSVFTAVLSIDVHDSNLKEQSYSLTESGLNEDYARYYDFKLSCEFLSDKFNSGTITISHLDEVNYIVSGTFEFDVYSNDCNRVIKVTDGRFDIRYAP
jgi:hypothetical protein